jgi:hypothetical protein
MKRKVHFTLAQILSTSSTQCLILPLTCTHAPFLYTLHTTLHPFLSSPQHNNENNNNNDTGMTMYQNYYKQITLLRNQETERATANNKLDIKIRDNKRGTFTLTDVAIS